MKRISVLISMLAVGFLSLFVGVEARADGRPIQPSELPAEAQNFLNTYYNNDTVRLATREREWDDWGYEVRLASGVKVEFSYKGEWMVVDAERQSVPEQLIPAPILEHLKRDFAGDVVVKIDRERRGYELELLSDLELKFDLSGRLLEIDD